MFCVTKEYKLIKTMKYVTSLLQTVAHINHFCKIGHVEPLVRFR